MKRELIVLNVALGAALVGTVLELRDGWLDFEATHEVSRIRFDGDPLEVPEVTEAESVPIQDWTPIVDQNLFSFDSNDLSIGTPEDQIVAGPRPFLFGTVALAARGGSL